MPLVCSTANVDCAVSRVNDTVGAHVSRQTRATARFMGTELKAARRCAELSGLQLRRAQLPLVHGGLALRAALRSSLPRLGADLLVALNAAGAAAQAVQAASTLTIGPQGAGQVCGERIVLLRPLRMLIPLRVWRPCHWGQGQFSRRASSRKREAPRRGRRAATLAAGIRVVRGARSVVPQVRAALRVEKASEGK